MDPYNRETSTNYPERMRAAKDILKIGRWHNEGVIYYENKVFALRIGNEGVILLEASNYKEAEYLAEKINHKLRIDLIRKDYQERREEANDD